MNIMKVAACAAVITAGGMSASAARPEELVEFPVSDNLRGHEDTEWSTSYAYTLAYSGKERPRVFLIGDSICAQYQGDVKNALAGKMNVTYWASSYCVTSPGYLKLLSFYLDEAEYAVIHFNNGLHSLKTPVEDWEKGFRAAIKLIKMKQPKAKLVWCSSTPLTYPEKTAKSMELNDAARKVIAEYDDILVDDLFATMDPLNRQNNWSDCFHFKGNAKNIQAKQVAECCLKAAGLMPERPATVALSKDGKAAAQIVIADDADRAARFAAYELKWHLDKITGGDFPIVNYGKLASLRVSELASSGGELASLRVSELASSGGELASSGDESVNSNVVNIFVGESQGTKTKKAMLTSQQYVVDVDGDSIELVGYDKEDKGQVSYFNDAEGIRGAGWPNMFDEQGTMYAVYDFLENTVGVKWLDSTDLGTILPENANLSVKTGKKIFEPFIRYRAHSGVVTRYDPLLWKKTELGHAAYEKLAYANPKARDKQGELFQIRHRMGGDCAPANHAFYDFYDRFWNKESKNFVEYHPEYFAVGYADGTLPPQLCYSNPATVERVIQDIREYFDNPKGPWKWGRNNYCLEPMDNCSFCKCPRCTAEYEPGRDGDMSSQSTHWYMFVNKVAREIAKSHPGKRIATLAYFQHEGLPKNVRLEKNVIVYFCLSQNRSPMLPGFQKQLDRMAEWRKAYPEQPLAMWLYNCFPLESANNANFHCFPGAFAHEAKKQYEFFKKIDVRNGIFHCGFDGELDNYLQLEWMIDPTRDVEELMDEYFSMYGKAGKYLREFYDVVEQRYCDGTLYPKGSGHQSAPFAWGILGTKDVMDKLAGLMKKAESVAETEIEKKRVELWKLGIYDYMKSGFDSYTERMAAPMPSWTAARVGNADGDTAKVDWTKLTASPVKYYGAGSDELSGYDGSVRMAHDGKWFYFELSMTVPDTKTLVNLPTICSHDCWEILIARQKGRPYRCWFVAPDGRMNAASWGEVNFRNGVSAEESGTPAYGAVCKSDLSDGRTWISRFAFPLDKFLDGPVLPGENFYLNAVNVMGPEHPEVQEWCKTHGGRFIISTITSHSTVHTSDRIGTVTLEK